MPCVCTTCAQHAQILGLDQAPRSRAPLRKAFKSAAKLWHPDRYERDPSKRAEAEERFKQIQVAYRELTEHLETPVQWPVEPAFSAYRSPEPFSAAAFHANPQNAASSAAPAAPPISFGNAPGCFVAPDFSLNADCIVIEHVREPDRALAIVDLSGPASQGSLAQYILFTDHGVFVRDFRNILSLLWYADLGEVRLVAPYRRGLRGLWRKLLERLSGTEQKYELEIRRHDGTLFHAIANQVDDSVKKVIYNFLQQRRPNLRR